MCVCVYAEPVESVPQPDLVVCAHCNRSFSRIGDRARHKCVVERAKPIAEPIPQPRQVYVQDACCAAHCAVCARCFRSVQGRDRHQCSRTGPRPTAQQRNSFSHVCVCSRRFRLPHHLRRHQAACSIFLTDAPPRPRDPCGSGSTGQVCVCVCAFSYLRVQFRFLLQNSILDSQCSRVVVSLQLATVTITSHRA